MSTPVLRYPKMVEATIAKESLERNEKIPHLNAYIEGIRGASIGLQNRYNDPGTDLTEEQFRTRMAGYTAAYDRANEQKRALMNAERTKAATTATYIRSSETVYTNANRVESKSGKNRLYLGSRREVAQYVADSDNTKKKHRILDAGVWSWDVNFAWLEGGINARACFKLKSELPEAVQQFIMQNSRNRISTINAKQFKALCENSQPVAGKLYSDLWHTGEKRLTWYALEIYTLLENGYRIRWADKEDERGIRFYLERPT